MEYLPHRISESNVQAELYRQLKEAGIDCELEYKIKRPGERGARFDCVILQGHQIPAIIEVKNHLDGDASSKRWGNSRQKSRYDRFGVPVLFCPGRDYIPGVVALVRDIINRASNPPGGAPRAACG